VTSERYEKQTASLCDHWRQTLGTEPDEIMIECVRGKVGVGLTMDKIKRIISSIESYGTISRDRQIEAFAESAKWRINFDRKLKRAREG